jgi:hypothetical protein
MGELSQQIQFAVFLISLGKATVEEVRDLFSRQGHDDEQLAAIMSQVDARIARRP